MMPRISDFKKVLRYRFGDALSSPLRMWRRFFWKKRNCILFVPTNGAGLGHITRLLAIARQVRRLNGEAEIVFFTTSAAMHLILQEGFLGYHLPSKLQFPRVSEQQWNQLFCKHLNMILGMHRPKMLVFDGVFPYEGLTSAMRNISGLNKVWIQRGQRKGETKAKLAVKEKLFDRIFVPGEAGQSSRTHVGQKYISNPVIFLEKPEALARDAARHALMVPEGKKAVYVQLGAGNINETTSTISILMNELEQRRDVYVVLGESIIGKRLDFSLNNGILLRDYPNSRYFNAFDLAVSAAGYNSFHELMYFGVPTVFIPNEQTKTDDQIARALKAENAGAAIVVRESLETEKKVEALREAINKALDKEINGLMKKRAFSLVERNGGGEIAVGLLRHRH